MENIERNENITLSSRSGNFSRGSPAMTGGNYSFVSTYIIVEMVRVCYQKGGLSFKKKALKKSLIHQKLYILTKDND